MKKLSYDRSAYWFILPNYLVYFFFVLLPVIWVVVLSLTRYEFTSPPEFIGFGNFARLMTDEVFHEALGNTFVYWVSTVSVSLVIGLILAVLLNRRDLKGLGLFRAAYYLPNVLSLVAVSMIWLWMYDPARGIMNTILLHFGLPTSQWLNDQNLALFAVIVPGIWVLIGFNMVVYLAGLQNIPDELYEAATVDGASPFRQFLSITVPLLKPISFFLIVMTSIRSFRSFDQIYVMTRGGPAKATSTLSYEIFEHGFQFYNMGYASAMSVVMLVIVAAITLANFSYGRDGGV